MKTISQATESVKRSTRLSLSPEFVQRFKNWFQYSVNIFLVVLLVVGALLGSVLYYKAELISYFDRYTISKAVMVSLGITQPHTIQLSAAISSEKEFVPTVNPEIALVATYMKRRNSKLPTEIANMLAEETVAVAAKAKLPVPLIVGIMEKESLFNPFAVSTAGAMGLMQVLQAEGVTVDPVKAFDVHYNITMGCTILKIKLKIAGGDLNKALGFYSNRTPGYQQDVMLAVGRYTLFTWKQRNESDGPIDEMALSKNMVKELAVSIRQTM